MHYTRATTVADARTQYSAQPDTKFLAGGQSLLAAMKLGMISPSHLIDLQAIAGLKEIKRAENTLTFGAMCTHAQIAASSEVASFCPMLGALAAGIGDAQVRTMGTIGGALAHNDPAACWPAGVLAMGATIITDAREIAADAFFSAIYTTCLESNEIIVAVRFPKPISAHYVKFEQPASRFAMVGVAIARFSDVSRIAITGLGAGVSRWPVAERALAIHFSVASLETCQFDPANAMGDLHASAAYRAHLVAVLTRRAVAAITGEHATIVDTPKTALQVLSASTPHHSTSPPQLRGSVSIPALPAIVWKRLLDPETLRRCVTGCEAIVLSSERDGKLQYDATIKVGIGPVSARFISKITLENLIPPNTCTLRFTGDGGAIGHGSGEAHVALKQTNDGTQLNWSARIQTGGKIAQLGSRLIDATAQKLIADFFVRFSNAISPSIPAAQISLWQRLLSALRALFR